jgi:hypothetical protein
VNFKSEKIAQGKVTKYGDNLQTNGIILSPVEKTLVVKTRPKTGFTPSSPKNSCETASAFSFSGAPFTSENGIGYRRFGVNSPV